MADYDIIGSIAIIKSESKGKPKSKARKLKEAKQLLKQPNIKTVLEKSTDIKGRLRTFKTKHLAGDKNLITVHKENNSLLKLNVQTCYFSPRQSNDRKNLAKSIKKNQSVLVMFSGIGSYPIIIKKLANPKHITSIEISRECTKYAKENQKLNKIKSTEYTIIQGDVKTKLPKNKFDIIIMTRPNLKTTFLKQALSSAKKNTKIFYQAFSHEDNLKDLKQNLLDEAKQLKRKIKITKTVKAGIIAPNKYRYRLTINVLN
jgi:tRNA (guanine37-N1)-methyltransferase|tara:strand:+ start:957 stop:1733 length:777 start_codon:yes stop_codon:yes gene_type:complete